jgi:hypothetical protein
MVAKAHAAGADEPASSRLSLWAGLPAMLPHQPACTALVGLADVTTSYQCTSPFEVCVRVRRRDGWAMTPHVPASGLARQVATAGCSCGAAPHAWCGCPVRAC